MVRHGKLVTALVVGIALLASLAFALGTLRSRPLENTEGCLVFEASRVRAGLPLYTDPVVGARDYGPVPARFHVLYPPLWSHVLALVATADAPSLGRAIGAAAWYGALLWIAIGANRRGRPLGVLFAAFVGGVYTLTLYGASARPDGAATAIAVVALERSVRAKRSGVTEGALFAVAAWLKPNVIGLGAGATASQLAAPLRVLAGWAATSAVFGAWLERASGGLFARHLEAATLQPLSLSEWTEQMTTRAPFFVVPVGFAIYVGYAGRADPGVRIAWLALTASVAWTLLSVAKIGSATCYFMEPCLGALVVCAHADPPRVSARAARLLWIAAPLQAIYTGVGSVRSSVEALSGAPRAARALSDLKAQLGPGELWLSDDAGVEETLDGRLVDTPFQTTALVRAGRFPSDVWIGDVRSPSIKGLVTTSDLLERPTTEEDVVHDRYEVRLRQALRAEFVLARRAAGYLVYVRR